MSKTMIDPSKLPALASNFKHRAINEDMRHKLTKCIADEAMRAEREALHKTQEKAYKAVIKKLISKSVQNKLAKDPLMFKHTLPPTGEVTVAIPYLGVQYRKVMQNTTDVVRTTEHISDMSEIEFDKNTPHVCREVYAYRSGCNSSEKCEVEFIQFRVNVSTKDAPHLFGTSDMSRSTGFVLLNKNEVLLRAGQNLQLPNRLFKEVLTPKLIGAILSVEDQRADMKRRHYKLEQELFDTIQRARTTKRLVHEWPEIAPIIGHLYAEAEFVETPLDVLLGRYVKPLSLTTGK